jgi:asparagine synthase (glutamine-hydrolysing)
MNRIAGCLHTDGRLVEPNVLTRMLEVMRLGKQDSSHLVTESCIGFASIFTGTKAGTPIDGTLFVHPSGRWMIVFDGRIDNRLDLFSALQLPFSREHNSIPDVEIVLAAYEKWGPDFTTQLVGDFALVIWDNVIQQLVCARDHLGVKPFYYSYSKDAFVFASTPDAILASGKILPRIQEERVADHLVTLLEGVDKTSSFYTDILRLPPGHVLTLKKRGVQLNRYGGLHPVDLSNLKSEKEFVAAFHGLLEEAVRCRLGGMTAAMFSGGLDSSSIVGVGRKMLIGNENRPLNIFAAISNSPGTNRETAYINSLFSMGNLKVYLISESELVMYMDELVKALENEAAPFDCLMNLNRSVYLRARDHGFSAVLDGVDGDVLLDRTEYLLQLWRDHDFHNIISETITADGQIAEYEMGKSLLMNSLISVFALLVPDWARRIRRLIRYQELGPTAVRETIINRQLAERSRLGERFATLDSQSPRPSSLSQVEFHKISLNHAYLTVGLERYERVASQLGIEARHPLLDIRLANFCLGLPWNMKIRRGWTKFILRRAMEPYLPSELIWRRDKDSLMWEYNRFLLKNRAEYFRQATLDEKQALELYVDTQKLEKFWQEYLTRGEEKHADQIWSGIALAFWLRRHRNMISDLKLQQ